MPATGQSYIVVSTVLSLFTVLLLSACNSVAPSPAPLPHEHITNTSPVTLTSNHLPASIQRELLQTLAISPDPTVLPVPDTFYERANHEKYASNKARDFVSPKLDPVLQLNIDNDTASYTNIRRYLQQGYLPPQHAVRVEQLLNYFSFSDKPHSSNQVVAINNELAVTPWNPDSYLLNISIQAKQVTEHQSSPRHLVFLIDNSGSMRTARKLPLLKQAIKLCIKHLNEHDKVSLITYADQTQLVLQPTYAHQYRRIYEVLDSIQASGNTAEARAGLIMAYRLASQHVSSFELNHIYLASDGDIAGSSQSDYQNYLSNISTALSEFSEENIRLSTLGFGVGNYNDILLQQLAKIGGGNYSYIDSLPEARRVLVDVLLQRINTTARKISAQVEFNPEVVRQYRLIGCDNNVNSNNVSTEFSDHSSLHPGQTVTFLFEIFLYDHAFTDNLRYQKSNASLKNEVAFILFEYNDSTNQQRRVIKKAIKSDITRSKASDYFNFHAAVAAFGQKLRGESYLNNYSYSSILKLAQHARGNDTNGDRNEFISMVRLARSLSEIAIVSSR